MRVMTEPLAGTRRYRARVARTALAHYRDPGDTDLGETTAQLASCARWLLDMLDPEPDPAPVQQRRTAQANTAVAALNARQLRDVLYAIAADQPRAVLNAIAEAGI